MVTREGVGFGTWPASPEIPGEAISFRQNLEAATLNPADASGRAMIPIG